MCNSDSSLTGKYALITGCNRGIGKSILQHFAEKGVNIIACIRKKNEEFDVFCQKQMELNQISIHIFYADLLEEESVRQFVSDLYKSKLPVHILINNAGVVSKGLLPMTSMQQLKDVFQINFFSQVQITQGVSKIMMRQKCGVIINMASIGGMDAFPAYMSYGCSKAAIIYFTKTMSQELASYHIRVNAVAPSMTDTSMKEEMGELANMEIQRRCAIKGLIPVNDVAKIVLFLASDDSSFINGQIIRVDGGM
ncbi:MAG: SDR family oxidoreductase [Paludibacteraceae bacterium]|nr:SDR family oxidoreductase [Paludibacteraceae bacterium]HOU68087.1 SDR family oxidoreductase [Paludibacteraceae bacterium]HQF49923.1 SDR family oxidoreductase [Paludibacteraceae bacterium]HQJ89137.1 SDR family oxidoreductase [Paludibacteraceae bacterium]